MALDKLARLFLLASCSHEGVLGFGPLSPAAVSSRPFVPAVTTVINAGSAAATAAAVGPLSAGAAGDSKGESLILEKCPVLICPAQLSIPSDYEPMVAEFKER